MNVRITTPQGPREIRLGTRLLELLDSPDCVGALVDGTVTDLTAPLVADADVRPVLRNSADGRSLLRRSATRLLFALAAREPGVRLEVAQTLDGHPFFEVAGGDAGLGARLDAAFQEAVAADHPFESRVVPVAVAAREVAEPRAPKEDLLRAWVGPRVVTVSILGRHDLAYGPAVPSTRFLAGYRVVAIPEGLLLLSDGAAEPSAARRTFLLQVARDARDWNVRLGVSTLGDLNRRVMDGKERDLVQVCETFHEMKIGALADAIQARPDVKIVFVSGPSSSGKTTFARRLSTRLRAAGGECTYVGMDDYYKDRVDCPKDESGDYDLEALEALDVERMGQDLRTLLTGEEAEIPRFDFPRQRRADRKDWQKLKLGRGQLLILEGIHGLNPAITDSIPVASRFGIYISAMPQLRLDETWKVPTTYSRLLRRIVRDRRYRGTPAAETIARWPSVRRGEDRHIFPHQDRADGVFNSALAYEIPVLRTFAWQYLLEVPPGHPSWTMARNLLTFLSLVAPLFPDWIPYNSVMREFIGGSAFDY